MDINNQDAGAPFKLIGGGGARGVAAGTGDATEAVGVIVDMQAQPGPMSGFLFVGGSAILQATETIDINDVGIEHGDIANLSDKADFTVETDHAAVATGGTGGTTEGFAIKHKADLTGIKRYWRVKVTPDLSASGTDLFQLGFGFAAICDESPQL